jgi:predicted esterase
MQDRIESVQTSLTALEPLLGPRTAHDGTVLIGYSRGAYLARDVLYSSHDKYLGAVFLAALIDPDPVRLKAAGVRRVVVGCGDYDGAKATLKRAAQKLPLAGIETRFVSFGPMGHGLPEDMGAKLGEALDWIREVKDTD